jgi:hypothetical protein
MIEVSTTLIPTSTNSPTTTATNTPLPTATLTPTPIPTGTSTATRTSTPTKQPTRPITRTPTVGAQIDVTLTQPVTQPTPRPESTSPSPKPQACEPMPRTNRPFEHLNVGEHQRFVNQTGTPLYDGTVFLVVEFLGSPVGSTVHVNAGSVLGTNAEASIVGAQVVVQDMGSGNGDIGTGQIIQAHSCDIQNGYYGRLHFNPSAIGKGANDEFSDDDIRMLLSTSGAVKLVWMRK